MTIRVMDIAQMTADAFGPAGGDLIGTRRQAALTLPRHVAMYVAHKATGRGPSAIALDMGGRDHTTVIHAVRKIEALITEDAKLAALVTSLIAAAEYRATLNAYGTIDVLAVARRIARDPRGGAMNASLMEIAALGVTLIDLWEVASAAEALIADLDACEVEGDPETKARITSFADAITDEMNHIAGPAETPGAAQVEVERSP